MAYVLQRDHPDEPVAVKVIGREAGEKWKNMSVAEKEPYETLSNASKAEYARMKQLTPAERIMVLAAQAMHHPVRALSYTKSFMLLLCTCYSNHIMFSYDYISFICHILGVRHGVSSSSHASSSQGSIACQSHLSVIVFLFYTFRALMLHHAVGSSSHASLSKGSTACKSHNVTHISRVETAS